MLASRCACFSVACAAFVACHQAATPHSSLKEEAFTLSESAHDADGGGFEPNCDPVALDPHSANTFFVSGIEATEKKPILIYERRSPMGSSHMHIVFYEDGTAVSAPTSEAGEITIAKVLDPPVDVARCVAQKIDGLGFYNGEPHARDMPYILVSARVGNVWRSSRIAGVHDEDVVENGPPTTASRAAEALMVIMEARMSEYAPFRPSKKRIIVARVPQPTAAATLWPTDLAPPPTPFDWAAMGGMWTSYFVDAKAGLEINVFFASHPHTELVAPDGTHVMLQAVHDALPDAPYLDRLEKCQLPLPADACRVPPQ